MIWTTERGLRRVVLVGSLVAVGAVGWFTSAMMPPADTPPDTFCADLAAARKASRPADVSAEWNRIPAELKAELDKLTPDTEIRRDTRSLAWHYEQRRRVWKFDTNGQPVPPPAPASEAEYLKWLKEQHPQYSAPLKATLAAVNARIDQKHPLYLAAHDDAERDIKAWRDACPAWWAALRRDTTITGWALGAGAAVWLVFFLARWLVRGFYHPAERS